MGFELTTPKESHALLTEPARCPFRCILLLLVLVELKVYLHAVHWWLLNCGAIIWFSRLCSLPIPSVLNPEIINLEMDGVGWLHSLIYLCVTIVCTLVKGVKNRRVVWFLCFNEYEQECCPCFALILGMDIFVCWLQRFDRIKPGRLYGVGISSAKGSKLL